MSQKNFGRAFKRALNVTASAAILAMAASAAHALPGRDDVGTDGMVDTENTWSGVGMMFAGGFVCTGQLVNARTVIFAAHCADNAPNDQYGTFGSIPMAFSFGVDALPGFQNWFANSFQSNPDMHVYNVLQYQTVLDTGFSFPGADVAMATLDTPAIGLPTYGMLFSAITEARHVDMVGYGGNGTGSTGPIGGIDWKRRAGENMVDALISQDDFLTATFGIAPGSWSGLVGPSGSQMMYHTDFDRPDRNPNDCTRGPAFLGASDITCTTPPFTNPITFDFTSAISVGDHMDWFPGDATDREAGTAGGDSGGALFSNFGGQNLILGVLSGGWTFTSPNGGYGDLSYYNPLFLYQNWIVAQNPYVYASAAEGDGVWSDASRWQQTLDPNYFVLDENGNAVNGLSTTAPTSALDAMTTTDGAFGTIFDTEVNAHRATAAPQESTAEELSTAATLMDIDFRGTIDLPGQTGKGTNVQVQDGSVSPNGDAGSKLTDVQVQDVDLAANFGGVTVSQDGVTGVASNLDPGTWVPNNHYGTFGTFNDPSSSVARFFNVTLSNAGTTTLDMNVELDTMSVANAEARFDIGADWTFNTLISFNQSAGIVDLNGRVNAREYMMTGGMLMGTGTLNTMTMWNIGGAVLPGSETATGTLDLWGDYVQSSAGSLVINVDGAGSSMLNITGDASLDGLLVFNPLAGYLPRYGDSYVFLNANSIIGGFASVMDLPGVLRPVVTLAGGQATLELTAESFSTQTTYTNLFQASLGNALDNARDTDYAALADIFGPLDLLSGDDLADALTSLTPFESVMFDRSLRSHTDTLNAALMGQIRNSGGSSAAEIAVAVQSAELQADGVASPLAASGAKMLFRHNHGGDMEASQPGLRAFGEVGYVSGDVDLTYGTGSTDLDGEFSLFGLEATFDSGWSVGAAVGMASTDMDSPSILNSISSETSTTQFSLFGGYQTERFGVSGFYSFASSETDAQRTVVMGGMSSVIASDLEGDATSLGVVADYRLTDAGAAYQIVPTASLVSTEFDYDATTAQAIPGANIDARSSDSLIARMGAHFSAETNIAGLRPVLYLGVASDFGAESEAYSASFQGAPNVSFGTTESIDVDEVWYEISVSIEREFETGATLSLGAFTEEGREVIDRTGVSVGVSVPF
ncbi:MAG: autotransporter outer membrane beta-barrel domain-containing protein [Maricaulis sp.]|uniref:autotransporter outer membrane beta-barrel domain-containing protein n=1 Tax=Maricaulis sp. TaxID=1486257 RepID=UPI001B137623|nr:autotransporter outer membrane beta-barrel domain-containing protein [Maricaulis sp.]MBO6729194.1 autotransporter outer membrane beta-barrel domain-containing protein [Maricaulis sp.]MBO6846069.1 autotransporter outer membrane beta-barrel domain-containing protein [Maricaulis sp.]MBO6876055.1 autotransporter outer membrane beta-barrel domain-containing protein [Maricaulis sp.]